MTAIPTTTLPCGEAVPVLGLGSWMMGDHRSERGREADALRLGLDLGMTLIDTAELYADGASEEVVADAVAGRRDEVFIVSKVMPSNASASGVIAACAKSLKRLRTDRIDLYLLHWPGRYPLAETVGAFERLKADGKIRHWGVSNFDPADMAALGAVTGGEMCQTNQVLYNLTRRGIEFDLLPQSQARGMPLMAYSPIEQGRLAHHGALKAIAARHDVTPAQIALAFVLAQPGVIAIPKASTAEHVRQNRAALDIVLTADDRAQLDAAFPPPGRAQSLEMI